MKYDIFIDESGRFLETSTDPCEQIAAHRERRKFPSQLAAILAREGMFSADAASGVFDPACEESHITVTDEFHGTELKRHTITRYNTLVQSICRRLQSTDFQPCRIVNRERVSFGNGKANHVNMLAEMLVMICKELERKDKDLLTLNIYHAGKIDGTDISTEGALWEQSDFVPTLNAAFQRASIARGWASESSKWRLGTFKWLSGKKDKRIWISDLLSNASHDNFTTVDPASKGALQKVFGTFDFSLSFNVVLQNVRELCDRQAYALGIIPLLEGILSPWVSQDAKSAYVLEFDSAFQGILALPPLARVPQLQTMIGWLHQIADDRDRLDQAKEICKWVDSRLQTRHESLAQTDDKTLMPWLRLSIQTAFLTACNHSGDLGKARICFDAIEGLIPSIAGRWEYATDLMRSMVVQCVHLNDCFEHEIVCEKMTLVAEYYRTLGGLFRDAYPEVFPDFVHSKVCGEALGTKLQSEIALLLNEKVELAKVRETSDQAIEQFSAESDIQRQFQYRSEIESIAGDWDTARTYLAKGIGLDRVDHGSLAEFIIGLPSKERAFPLLHWTRIGGMAALAGEQAEFDAFYKAWQENQIDAAIQSGFSGYPEHGILRRVAAIYATLGDFPKMTETLRTLHSVVQENPKPLFRLIEVASILQAAGAAGRRSETQMTRTLSGGNNDSSIQELLGKLVYAKAPKNLKISKIAGDFLTIVQSKPSPARLIEAGRRIGY